MKPLANTIVAVVVTFIITLSLQTALSYVTQSKGTVAISPAGTIQQQFYVSVDIANYGAEPINNIILSIPRSTVIQGITSSNPVQLDVLPDAIGTELRKRLTISGIEPRRVTKLLIPISNQDNDNLVQVINDKQVGLTLSPVANLESPVATALSSSLQYAIIAAIAYGIYAFWILTDVKHRSDESQKKAVRLEEDIKKAQEKQEELVKESSKMQKDVIRVRLLLLARLQDYAKELDFWRDTIRKILYQATHEEMTATTLINQVTETLKTYGTHDRQFDFEAITMLANLVSKSSKEEEKAD